MFNALVDTGAAISCIDNNLATSLNLPFVGTSKFGGAAVLVSILWFLLRSKYQICPTAFMEHLQQ